MRRKTTLCRTTRKIKSLNHVIGPSNTDNPTNGENPAGRDWPVLDGFDPNRLLDALIAKMHLENDGALASKLQVIEPIIRMIRDESLSMSPSMLFEWIQEATSIKADELKDLMENRKPRP